MKVARRACQCQVLEIVRVTVNNEEAAKALPDILKQVSIPVVADIHFDHKMAMAALATDIACVRINPGNIGNAQRVKEVVQAAKDHGCSMRIGVNGGSLEKHLLEKYGEPCPEAMVESAQVQHGPMVARQTAHSTRRTEPTVCT